MTATPTLLQRMTQDFPTQFWSDSCEVTSLSRAIEQGASGATSNPVIVLEAIELDRPRWIERARGLVRDHPDEPEERIAWRLVEQAACEGADLLRPVFERHAGKRGRLSVQVNPRNFPSAPLMVAQAQELARLRPNIAIKVPAVAAGPQAVEELTALGISVNATVSYTLSQAVVIAEAMERGLQRARAAGLDPDTVTPWVTIMVGRLDDHLRDIARAQQIAIDAEHVRQASIAVFRKTYRLFRQRGYRATLLSAAMRSHHHWSELVGGDCVITIPPAWQDKFNASGVELRSRIDDEVDLAIIEELRKEFVDFGLAYDEGALPPERFVQFGAARKTLHQFIEGYESLLRFVRDVMLPL